MKNKLLCSLTIVWLILGVSLFSNETMLIDFKNEDMLSQSGKADESSQWSLSDIGTLSTFDEVHFIDCTDNGLVLIYARLQQEPYQWAIWHFQKGLILIPKHPSDGWEDKWIRINCDGLVIGFHQRPVPKSTNSFYYDLITWCPECGRKEYSTSIQNKKTIQFNFIIPRCGNSDLVIFNREADSSEDNKVFLLQHNQLSDLTIRLDKKAQSLGFKPGGWIVFEVNSRGMLLGKFCDYEPHPYKNVKLEVSTHYFILDKDDFYLVDWPKNFFPTMNTSLWHGGGKDMYFDAEGRILFCDSQSSDSMIWSRESGLAKLEPSSYIKELVKLDEDANLRAVSLLEDGTIVWFLTYKPWLLEQPYRGYIFSQNENHWFLPCDSNGMPIFKNFNDYQELKLKEQSYKPLFKNTHGFIQVDIFGESHPFAIMRDKLLF